jgi:hypothetical protein
MPGLDPGIHVFYDSSKQDVDGRVKLGHDESKHILMLSVQPKASRSPRR